MQRMYNNYRVMTLLDENEKGMITKLADRCGSLEPMETRTCKAGDFTIIGKQSNFSNTKEIHLMVFMENKNSYEYVDDSYMSIAMDKSNYFQFLNNALVNYKKEQEMNQSALEVYKENARNLFPGEELSYAFGGQLTISTLNKGDINRVGQSRYLISITSNYLKDESQEAIEKDLAKTINEFYERHKKQIELANKAQHILRLSMNLSDRGSAQFIYETEFFVVTRNSANQECFDLSCGFSKDGFEKAKQKCLQQKNFENTYNRLSPVELSDKLYEYLEKRAKVIEEQREREEAEEKARLAAEEEARRIAYEEAVKAAAEARKAEEAKKLEEAKAAEEARKKEETTVAEEDKDKEQKDSEDKAKDAKAEDKDENAKDEAGDEDAKGENKDRVELSKPKTEDSDEGNKDAVKNEKSADTDEDNAKDAKDAESDNDDKDEDKADHADEDGKNEDKADEVSDSDKADENGKDEDKSDETDVTDKGNVNADKAKEPSDDDKDKAKVDKPAAESKDDAKPADSKPADKSEAGSSSPAEAPKAAEPPKEPEKPKAADFFRSFRRDNIRIGGYKKNNDTDNSNK